MDNWLLVALFGVSVALNLTDSILTRFALKRGHPELNPFTRKLINELGLDRAMIVKSLLPLPLLFLVIIGWLIPVIGSLTVFVCSIILAFYAFVVIQNCIQLLRSHKPEY